MNRPQTWHSITSANTQTLNPLNLPASVAFLTEVPWEQCSARMPANSLLLQTFSVCSVVFVLPLILFSPVLQHFLHPPLFAH